MTVLDMLFMRNAIFVGLLVSVVCGVIGTYVVVKRISFISGSISHTAYGGIGVGYYLGINPMLGATLFTVLAALAIGLISRQAKQREDSIIGMIWALGMAVGIIFVSLTPGYTGDLMSYLFGSILTVPPGDIGLIAGLNAIVLGIVGWFYDELKALVFDEEFAEVNGVSTTKFYLLLLVLIAFTVVVMIRAVGIILVIALLTIPAAIAAGVARSLVKMMLYAVVLGMVFTMSGLYISYLVNLPSGATIILTACIGFVVAGVIKKIQSQLLLQQSWRNTSLPLKP